MSNYLEYIEKKYMDLISKNRYVASTCFLIIFVAFVVFLFVYGIAHYALPDIGAVSIDSDGWAVNFKGKSRSVITVPAYKLFVDSGVNLKRDQIMIIRAKGLVSTCTDIPKGLLNSVSIEDKWPQVLKELVIERDIHLGWRNPIGEHEYKKEVKNKSKDCIERESEELRLDPNKKYGYLIGIVVVGDEPVGALKLDAARTIPVGFGVTIKYDKKSKEYKVINKEGKLLVTLGDMTDARLYFAVNDTIIMKAEKLKLSGTCKTELLEGGWKISDVEKIESVRDRHIELYAGMKNSEGIWYLNNRGSFTVSIVTRPD
jgi:hypothetical protein